MNDSIEPPANETVRLRIGDQIAASFKDMELAMEIVTYWAVEKQPVNAYRYPDPPELYLESDKEKWRYNYPSNCWFSVLKPEQ